ncbi:MAG: hypothetical protein WC860_01695 [Candidatus Margulisiibacteriota bacterium]|jgi:hypothetical protein
MKSVTIHGMEDNIYFLVKKKAQELGLSLNKTIQALITESLGIQKKKVDHKENFLEFYGCWNKNEETEFLKTQADLRKIDAEDWA